VRASTFISHRQRVGRAVSHIDRHLDDDMDVRQLADLACFSPYHFLRVFQELTSETPLSMVRRLRLERARRQLATGASVTQAAEGARFDSPQAFCRAFRSVFGMAPSRISKAKVEISPPRYRPSIVRLAPRRAIFIDFCGPASNVSDEIGHLLGLARPLMQRFPAAVATLGHGDGVADPDQHYTCRMLVMLPEEGLAEAGLPVTTVGGGVHIVWQRRGPLSAFHSDYQTLVGNVLPAWGYRKAEAPTMRVYHNDPALVPRAQQRRAMLVPVVSR
jgi:AraC family transcriptional regulator